MKNLIFSVGIILLPIYGFSQHMEITVLTYNIYHGEKPDSLGKPNLEEIAELILDLKPDVVALQEIDSMTLRSAEIFGEKTDIVSDLAKMTGYQGFFAKAMEYSEGGYGEGILVKGNAHFIHQQLSVPVGGEPRSAAWAKLTLANGDEVLVGATHLCHQYEENRSAQFGDLISFSQKSGLPVILMGDFNFISESKSYRLTPENWTDAALEFDSKKPTYGSLGEGKRIDYIFADRRFFEVIDYQVINVPHSDHYPVRARIKIQKP